MRTFLLGLLTSVSLLAQINVQKGSGNVLSNGNIVVGNNTSITATGTGVIAATGIPTITIATTAPLTGGGALTGNLTLAMPQSNTTTNGWLSGTDWTTFNAKQPAITGSTNLTLGAITFNQSYTGVIGTGILQWNAVDSTLDLGLNSSVTLQIGQEYLQHIKNVDSVSLTDGMVVYAYGAQGQELTVKRAIANDPSIVIHTIGVATQTIAAAGSGFITLEGIVNNVNTQGYTDGDPIWLSDSVLGGFTKTKPTAPTANVLVGYIVKGGSVGGGSILVSPRIIPNATMAVQTRPAVTQLVGGTSSCLDAVVLTSLDNGTLFTGYFTGGIVATYRLRARVGSEPAVAQWKVISTVDSTRLWELVGPPSKDGVTAVWNASTSKFHQILLTGTGTLILSGYASEANAFTIP